MHAAPGDWLVVESGQTGGTRRIARVIEAHGDGGTPPFLVRWTGDDHESLVFPGPDAHTVSTDPSAGIAGR